MDPLRFARAVRMAGVSFVTGVPDSLLKDLNSCLERVMGQDGHLTATNEGAAIGLAIGHYLATQSPAVVYMQNSGIGNAVNPLASLTATDVFGIPMVLIIGWRAELVGEGPTQVSDEPQHQLQGQITLKQLEILNIPYEVVDGDDSEEEIVERAVRKTQMLGAPVALVVRKGAFLTDPAAPIRQGDSSSSLWSRESAIEAVLETLGPGRPVIATTGMAAREVFEIRKRRRQPHEQDLLVVGGMGHALAIAVGLARQWKSEVLCLDGDGALLMHTGTMALAAMCPGLIHVVLNNGAHDSVGGQATRAKEIDLREVARSMGYGYVNRLESRQDCNQVVTERGSGAAFLEVLCRTGNRSDLGRPAMRPVSNRDTFMGFLKENSDACVA